MKKIIIIHGWTYTTDTWNALKNELRAAGYEPTLLTVPGLTETTDSVWTLDGYVEWLKEQLTTSEDAVILGHSNGGRIALAFALAYPQKIKFLILMDSAGIYHNGLPIRLKRILFGALAAVGRKITSSETLRRALYTLSGESDYKNASPLMRQTMTNLIAVDLAPRLHEITAPTLIIWGGEDTITPVADGELMHQAIKTSELFIIKDARHSPHSTHARQVSTKILSTLRHYDI